VPCPDPTSIETLPSLATTCTSAAVLLSAMAFMIALLTSLRSEPTRPIPPSTTSSGGIGAVAEALPVASLAIGGRLQRKRVLPVQVVPVGHVKGERQDVGALVGQLIQKGVGRRARRAALRGEKLHHDRPVRRCGSMGKDRRKGTENKHLP
jgi:hypothetical protein